MTRYHATSNGRVAFTPDEEAEADTEDQAWIDGALDRTKAAKITEFKAERIEANAQPINNVQVATAEDIENINGAINVYTDIDPNDLGIRWGMVDNTISVLHLSDLVLIRKDYAVRKHTLYNTYKDRLILLDAATTLEEIEAIE